MLLPERENIFDTIKKSKYYIPAVKEEWEKDEDYKTQRQQKIRKRLKSALWILAAIAFVVLGSVVLSDPNSWAVR